MGKTVRTYDKFEYFMDDTRCEYCLFYKGKSKHRKHGCERPACCCEAEKRDAMAHGRITRKRGWEKCRE